MNSHEAKIGLWTAAGITAMIIQPQIDNAQTLHIPMTEQRFRGDRGDSTIFLTMEAVLSSFPVKCDKMPCSSKV